MFKLEFPGEDPTIFNTASILGHPLDDADWYAQKSRGILNDFVPRLP